MRTTKAFAWITLVMTIVSMLCACGKRSETTTAPSASFNERSSPTGYLFTYKGFRFGVNMDAAEVLEQLGPPKNRYTSKSCAFAGEDTIYYYSSIQVSTNNELGYERIYSIYLEDDLVSTEEGICVGNTTDDVISAYGEPSGNFTGTCLNYDKQGMSVSFHLSSGVVSSILYSANIQ